MPPESRGLPGTGIHPKQLEIVCLVLWHNVTVKVGSRPGPPGHPYLTPHGSQVEQGLFVLVTTVTAFSTSALIAFLFSVQDQNCPSFQCLCREASLLVLSLYLVYLITWSVISNHYMRSEFGRWAQCILNHHEPRSHRKQFPRRDSLRCLLLTMLTCSHFLQLTRAGLPRTGCDHVRTLDTKQLRRER